MHNSRRVGQRGKKFLLILEGSVTEPIYFKELKGFYPKIKGLLDIEKSFKSDIDKMISFARDSLKKKRKAFELPYDKVFIVIDRDHFENEKGTGIGLEKIKNAIKSLSNENKIEIILTAPRFEYWLYLHFKKERPSSINILNSKLEKVLKEHKIISKECNVVKDKNEIDSQKMLKKLITSGKTENAYRNAKEVSKECECESLENRSPHTCMHSLIEYLEIL